jgi:hypothetical protein
MHRLALGLGMTVSELRVRMPRRELTEWMAYYQMEPFGERRADVRSAIVAAILANANREKDQKPYKVKDFVLFKDDEEDEED